MEGSGVILFVFNCLESVSRKCENFWSAMYFGILASLRLHIFVWPLGRGGLKTDLLGTVPEETRLLFSLETTLVFKLFGHHCYLLMPTVLLLRNKND